MSIERQNAFRIIPKSLISAFPALFNPVVDFFVRLKINPNTLTLFAPVFALTAGIFFALRRPFWAGILIIACGIFDILDGKVAVKSEKRSLYGAILDSTLDRYSEFFIFFGLALYFKNHWAIWLIFWNILGSFMVSYTKARAEGLGIDCKAGFIQRAERLVFLSAASLIGPIFKIFDPLMIGLMIFMVVVTNMTAFQRILLVKKAELKASSKDPPIS